MSDYKESPKNSSGLGCSESIKQLKSTVDKRKSLQKISSNMSILSKVQFKPEPVMSMDLDCESSEHKQDENNMKIPNEAMLAEQQ